ncbi:hypothetical protein Btru_064917 [Bulinus truncatus]|nr:hypothetical protein Btru_064917 [Bulinus truncatus]
MKKQHFAMKKQHFAMKKQHFAMKKQHFANLRTFCFGSHFKHTALIPLVHREEMRHVAGVGKLSNTPDKNISSRGHSHSSDPPWGPPSDPRRAYSHDNSSGRYRDGHHWSPGQSHREKELSSDINRRKSDGQTLSAAGGSSFSQQQRQLLLSMRSSPNLAKPPDGSDPKEEAIQPPKGPSHLTAKSSPNILDDVGLQDAESAAMSLGMQRSSSDFNMKHGGGLSNLNNSNNNSSSKMHNSDYYNYKNTSREHMRRSLPAHNLHRYQPDYENVLLLGTEPIGSEKISEIDDIDEVTGKDSNPQSPDVKPYNPMGGAGLPTRDPASLKYIKVNQNHEKYPSWPVTKPSGASEETQPINTRAQSMTDNTNTSKEFPQKQRLAYTPGLRPLMEKNSPVTERKSDGRNTSDPGIKSEFVYDKFGRVVRRSNDSVEHRFEDFYKNSQPGYPPPKMDPDGHNIGDKEYNAPSPPERESKGLDSHELSSRLTGSDDYGRYHQQVGNFSRFGSGNQTSSYIYQESYRSGSGLRPTNLNLNFNKQPMEQTSKGVDTGTSPLDQGSPLNHRDIRSNSQGDTSHASSQQQQQQSRPRSWHDPFKQGSPLQSWQEKSYQYENRQQSPCTQSPSAQVSARAKLTDLSDRSPSPDSSAQPGPQRDRPGSDKNKAYIVKSTPYYNTSTQTESSVPYAIKLSNPATVASKLRNAETQVGEFGTQTSPKTPEDQKKMFEEKSIQARMSRDFQISEAEQKFSSYEGKKPHEDVFRFPASSLNKSSPFTGIQNIHAKYATDESPLLNTSSDTSKSSTPAFNDNSASILRKLSEEFYGNKLGLMGDKRMSSSSSQEQSPKFETTVSSSTLQQPGLREAESYSSVVIHHEETGGLFGRDDYGSMSSIGDPAKPDSSYPFLDVSKKTEVASAAVKSRRSLDPAFLSQKNQQMDIRASSTTSGPGLQREISCPAVSGYPGISTSLATSKSYNAFPHSASASELLSAHPRPKSSSSESRSSQGTSLSGRNDSTSTASNNDLTAATSTTQNKASTQFSSEDQRKMRLDSDSVFISADDDTTDYQFERKPSLRKAYGIYDETERLISQSSNISSAKQTSKGKEPARLLQDGGGSPSGVYLPMSRGSKYSESQTLDLIQEEGDSPNVLSDSSGVFSSLSSWSQSGRREEPTRYHWQSESWLKSQADLAKGSNLKRTSSEQIAVTRPTTSVDNNKFSSYEADTGQFKSADKTGAVFPGPSPINFDHRSSSSAELTSSGHARTHSEDLTQLNEPSLRKFQQQALLSFIHRKTQGGGVAGSSSSSHPKDNLSTDSSMYESIEGNSSESVADIISKATENLAKSAQRVDTIRRSNSTSSRSSDYMDMTKYDRMRRETEWSKLRSSGSLRYGPDDERRSRSSFASENHYEDISLFSPSTPRDSFAESVDIMVDTANPDASMDSGLVASPTYQNYPSKRRPPPPVPRSPSPDAPPALPPRKYRETESASMEAGDITEAPLEEKNRVHTIPLGKPLEDSQVDNTKRDFRSLMSQWENSSPREDKYAAELRKQAQRLTGHQQQQQQNQLSAMPMTVMHSKPKISVATTYKREPTQPQEATSPSTSSLSSSSVSSLPSLHNNNSSSNAPSSSTVGGSSASPTSSTSAIQSSSGISAAWQQQQQQQNQPRSDGTSSTAATSVSGLSAVSNSMTHTSSSVKLIQGLSQASSSSSNAPQLPERTFFAEDHRLRSSSDVMHNKLFTTAAPPASSSTAAKTPRRKPESPRCESGAPRITTCSPTGASSSPRRRTSGPHPTARPWQSRNGARSKGPRSFQPRLLSGPETTEVQMNQTHLRGTSQMRIKDKKVL